MIAFLKGKLVYRDPTFVVVEVQGVGYQLQISLQTFSDIKEQENIMLHTHLNIREDAHVLFGFSTTSEKKLFQQLISVNGVGPSTAIVMLSYMNSNELKAAIVREDAVSLQAIKGIGGKTAQRVIIELKDKLKKESWEETQPAISLGAHNTQGPNQVESLTLWWEQLQFSQADLAYDNSRHPAFLFFLIDMDVELKDKDSKGSQKM